MKFILNEKYNIRWEFWVRFSSHCAVPCVKVQKSTTKIGETSSLIRHMYILEYIVIRSNQYLVMHDSRVAVVLRSAYHGATKCLSEHVYTTRIRHGIYTTRLHNTPIQHANRKLSRKERLTFIEVIKGGK